MALGLAATVQANPIVGSIGFDGTYKQVDGTQGDLTTATWMWIRTMSVVTASDDFSGAVINGAPGAVWVNASLPAHPGQYGSMGTVMFQFLVGATQYQFVCLSI
jgi:hypothetical protein